MTQIMTVHDVSAVIVGQCISCKSHYTLSCGNSFSQASFFLIGLAWTGQLLACVMLWLVKNVCKHVIKAIYMDFGTPKSSVEPHF